MMKGAMTPFISYGWKIFCLYGRLALTSKNGYEEIQSIIVSDCTQSARMNLEAEENGVTYCSSVPIKCLSTS